MVVVGLPSALTGVTHSGSLARRWLSVFKPAACWIGKSVRLSLMTRVRGDGGPRFVGITGCACGA